jgi:hypothetical protein
MPAAVMPMVARWFIFKPKIPIWVNFGGPYIDWKMLIYFMAIWNILRTFGIFYDHLVHFVFVWYIFSCFGTMYQEKSGNPVNADAKGAATHASNAFCVSIKKVF